jgi:hypothetical protein
MLESVGHVNLKLMADEIDISSSNIPLLAHHLARFVDNKRHKIVLEKIYISHEFVARCTRDCDSLVESLVASSTVISKKKKSAISSNEISVHLKLMHTDIESELLDYISRTILSEIRESFERVFHQPSNHLYDRELFLTQLLSSLAEEFAKFDLFLQGISKIEGIYLLFYVKTDDKLKTSLLEYLSSTIGNQVFKLVKAVFYLITHEDLIPHLSSSQAVEKYSIIDIPTESSLIFTTLRTNIEYGKMDLIRSALPLIMGPLFETFVALIDNTRVLNEYRSSLQTQLERAQDDVAALHISALLLFIREHNTCALHASGKFVPSIIKFGFVANDEMRILLGKALKHVKAMLSSKGVDDKVDIMSQVRKMAVAE